MVLGMLAVLVGIALPAHERILLSVWRTQAATCLLELAQALESPDAAHAELDGALPGTPCTRHAGLRARYAFQVEPVAPWGYQLQAVPIGAQVRDMACMTLQLDALGVRHATGTAPAGRCW